jgi:RsiW-degrading membrane proteinase PrsW (M82 family)
MPVDGICFSTLPVLCFLGLLVLMDSFKLVTRTTVLLSIGVGVLTAFVALQINTGLLDRLEMSLPAYRRYGGPVIEETAKALWIVVLVRARRLGFLVDAAIHGFAVGTGFALVENVHYLRTLSDASVLLWIVRGFGTAILHGSTTAIFATLAKGLTDRHGSASLPLFVGPLALAILIHSTFNHFVLPPLAMTALLLVVMPLLFIFVFEQSEKATRRWLGTSFDSRLELLDLILSGDVRQTHVGSYLQSLRDRFPPVVVGDMLCFLRIHLELSMRAKTQLLAREAGTKLEIGDEVRANFEELEYLERSIGRTGRLALAPFLASSPRDLLVLRLLGK